MKLFLCVLATWLLEAGALSSSDLTQSVKNFDLLAEGDANLLDNAKQCGNGLGTPVRLSLTDCPKYKCHLKRGNTYTLSGTIVPGSNNAGFLGQASTKVLGVEQNVFNQQDDNKKPCVMGESVTLDFTFKILEIAAPGEYNVTMELLGVDENNTVRDVQFCGSILVIVDVI